MRKNYNCALGVITLGFAELLYFLWLPSPKCMFRSLGQPWAYQDIITGVIHAVLLSIVLIMCVKSISKPGEKYKLFSLMNFALFAALLVVQLLKDWLQLSAEKRFPDGSFAVDYALILAVWLAFALILLVITGRGTWKNKKAWLPLIAVVLILAVFVLLDLRDAGIREEILTRYKPTAELPRNRLMNMRFSHEMRCLGLDLACGAAYLVRVALNTTADPEEEKDRGRKGRLVLRAYCLLTVAFFLYIGKATLLPNNAIQVGYIWHGVNIMNFSARPDTFTQSRSDYLRVMRGNGDGDEWYIYRRTKVTVGYNERDIFSFKKADFDTSAGLLIISDWDGAIVKNPSGGEANVCKSGAIVWTRGDEVKHLQLEDLPSAEQDDILTVICIDMLSRGDLGFFEYGLDYMMKYEPELMTMYIERYAAGDFTEQEQAGDYNTEYIQRLAENAILQPSQCRWG